MDLQWTNSASLCNYHEITMTVLHTYNLYLYTIKISKLASLWGRVLIRYIKKTTDQLPVTVSNRLNARQRKTKQFYGIHKLGKFVECKTRIR